MYKELINNLAKKGKDYTCRELKILKLDTIHGVNVPKIIEYAQDVFGDIELVASGPEVRRQLDFYDLKYIDFFKDMVKQKIAQDGSVKFELKEGLPPRKCYLFWSIAELPIEFLSEILPILNTPIILIGDMTAVDYFQMGKCKEYMKDSHLIEKIKKVHGFSQEIVFLSDRIRKGKISDVKDTSNRTYTFTSNYPALDKLIEYDVVVVSRVDLPPLTKSIREDIFDYPILPQESERMINYQPILTQDRDTREKLFIEVGSELICLGRKYKGDDINNEYIFKYEDHEIEIAIDENYIYNLFGVENDLNYNSSFGYKLFYSYCIPPEIAVSRTWNSVFAVYDSYYGNNKAFVYTLCKSARKKLHCVYNEGETALF